MLNTFEIIVFAKVIKLPVASEYSDNIIFDPRATTAYIIYEFCDIIIYN